MMLTSFMAEAEGNGIHNNGTYLPSSLAMALMDGDSLRCNSSPLGLDEGSELLDGGVKLRGVILEQNGSMVD